MKFFQRSMRSLNIPEEPLADTATSVQTKFSPEDIVRAAYLSILRRDADASGLQHYASRLSAQPDDLPQFLKDMLHSAESVRRNSPALLNGSEPLRMDVVSLGTSFFTSSFLKRQGLQHSSGPFDRIFSSIPMVAHCIDDKFQLFLDKDFYRPVLPDQRKAGDASNILDHAYYLAKFQVHHVFNQHEMQLPRAHDEMRRCVHRFMEAMAAPKPLLYVVHCRIGPTALNELRHLSTVLQAANSAHRLVAVLVDSSKPGLQLPQTETLHDDDMLVVHRYVPVSRWRDLEFDSLQDEISLSWLIRSSVRHSVATA